jgi:lon-related putative ATP-dependent protease
MAIKSLKPADLRKSIPLNELGFKSTKNLTPLDGIIGQDRAMRAIQLALEMDFSGYNIFVTGKVGTGRTTIVQDLLNKFAKTKEAPHDWCYVYNFNEPDSPHALCLPQGKACQFQKDMEQLIKTLKTEVRRVFRSKKYEDQKLSIFNKQNDKKRKLLEQLNKDAQDLRLQIQSTPTGFQTVVIKDDKPLESEQYQQLSDQEKQDVNERIHTMENKISKAVRLIARLDFETQKSLSKLDEQVASFVVEQFLHEVKEKYDGLEDVEKYLDEVRVDVILNIGDFVGEVEKEEQKSDEPPVLGNSVGRKKNHFKRYSVNVVVDNSQLKGAPVIYEPNPTYHNMFGRIEKYSEYGTYLTDFTMIKAGTLLKANGGYLVTDALEIFRNPFVYDALKRAIRNKEIRIEDVSELYGVSPVSTLKPSPIPLNVKIVLIGRTGLYNLLQSWDEDFSRIFKIRADFDYETDSNKKAVRQYAQFVKKVVDEENLIPFDNSAIHEIITYGHRLVEDQVKLSLKFGSLTRVIRETNYWAKKDRSRIAKDIHVKKAISEYEYRHSLVEEKIQETIERDIFKIIVDGEAVGQINGLSVYQLGEYVFGRPHRITSKTYIGNENVVHIERKAHLSGKIHDKGVYVLSGFFNWKFGEFIPLSFSASIAFEQSYSMIDGDSASSTELYALISSLSGVPIQQGIAVTGSVNQNGEVQAIGGVNEKIEGYFKVCQAKGLTGKQGVMIPRSNVDHLMLKDEVVEAVKKNKFHIWAIDTIEDGLKILTGRKVGRRNKNGKFPKNTIYHDVEETLREFSRRNDEYRKSIDKKKAAKKAKENNNKENDEEE